MIDKIYSPKKFKELYKKPRFKLFLKIAGGVVLAGILLTIGTFAYFAKDLPSSGRINKRFIAESTKIYDRTGDHILYDIHGEEKRTQIDFTEMPDVIKFATIALEDQSFYHHRGIKLSSIFRALIKDILHRGAAQGGSTITQQFIKNSILTNEKSITRKIKEVILSIELEFNFSKDDILGMYLNEIPYGSNAYGIEAAAQTFFNKHAHELTLDEAALLAGLPKAPSYYSPYGVHTDALKIRQEIALNEMADLGYITKEQATEAKEKDVFGKLSSFAEKIEAPHFVMYVKDYLETKYGAKAVEEQGLKVYTTLDWDKQQVAERVVKEGAEKNLTKYKAENAALVAIDPKTGQILTMVGSKDFFDTEIDGQVNVAIRDRQPGSSFKPYVYLKAFEKGYTPETILWDVDTDFSTDSGEEYNPKNYDGENRGPLKIKEALGMSLNVPAVKLLYLAGVYESVELAKKMGITTLNRPQDYGLSLVLGGGEVKLLDHVNAFATLANKGVYQEKNSILRIEDAKGNILEEYKEKEGEKVIDEKYIAMLDHILSTNAYRAPVFGENNPLKFTNRPVVAKTGTTNEWRDGWTMGYTPSIAVGVWTGNNDNSVMAEGADGSYVASPIWRAFMDEVLKNYNIEKFPEYNKEEEETGKDVLDGKLDFVKKLDVCEIPGKKDKYCLANSSCPDKLKDEKKFFTGHSILYYVNKDFPQGEDPDNRKDDPQYKEWEKAIEKWAEDDKEYDRDEAPEDDCKSSDFEAYRPEISITSPSNGKTITSPSFGISINSSSGFGLKHIKLYIEGIEVTSQDNNSFTYTYSVPADKYQTNLTIKAKITDDADFSETTDIDVKTQIP